MVLALVPIQGVGFGPKEISPQRPRAPACSSAGVVSTPLDTLLTLRQLQLEHEALQARFTALGHEHEALAQSHVDMQAKMAQVGEECRALAVRNKASESLCAALEEALHAQELQTSAARDELFAAREVSLRGWREMVALERQAEDARAHSAAADAQIAELQQVWLPALPCLRYPTAAGTLPAAAPP